MYNNEWFLVIGKDKTSSTWKGNEGNWEYSTFWMYDAWNRYRTMDESMGPFNEGTMCIYFTYRAWVDWNYFLDERMDGYSNTVRRMRLCYMDGVYRSGGYDYQYNTLYKQI